MVNIFSLLVLPSLSLAQTNTVYTTSQLPYTLEYLGHSSRAIAMGSAFASAEGDAACLFWNPAGLDGLPSSEISLTHQDWLSNFAQESFVAALPIEKAGTFALGGNYLNFGTLDGYGPTGDPTISYHPFRATLSLGWGGTLIHNLSIGIAAEGLYESLTSGYETFTGSLCLGGIWRVLPSLRVGGYYSFSSPDPSAELAMFKLGEAWAVPLFQNEPTLLLVDFALPPQGVYLIEAGAEQSFLSIFFARAGFRQELRDNEIQGFRGFTGGVGIKLAGFDLDYSYVPDGQLGYSQNVGLTYQFPEGKPKKTSGPSPGVAVNSTIPGISLPGLGVPSLPSPPAAPSSPAEASNPGLSFKPPASITSADKMVQVEVHFDLPQPETIGTPIAISPELQKALDEGGQKIAQNPKDYNAWVSLGNLYWQAGQPEYTLQCFEEAQKLQPSNPQLKAWIDQYQRLHPPSNK